MNGNGWKNWMLGALFAIAFALGGNAVSALSARVQQLEIVNISREAQIAVLQTQIVAMQAQLDRIEAKLDRFSKPLTAR